MLAFSLTAYSQWQKAEIDTQASFRGLDVVSRKIVWASGTGGTVVRTVDGGKNWKVIRVPGAEKLDFRDIEAFGKKTAYVLSIGNGENSRIYKTTDGGDTWKLQFTNPIPDAFFDSIAFWDKNHGLAQSDPVDGKYVFFETTDGETWTRMPPSGMPSAKGGEAAFAASGTCIVTQGKKDVFLITGGKAARVFRSTDRGRSWKGFETEMVSGKAGTGIFGIAVHERTAAIVGGDYQAPSQTEGTFSISLDGGDSWSSPSVLGGYRSGVAFAEMKAGSDSPLMIAVGPTGAEASFDRGKTWKPLGKTPLNVVQSAKGVVWAAGPGGTIGRFDLSAFR